MRSLTPAGALAVNRSGGSQIRSTWQSAEMTSYFIALPSFADGWRQRSAAGGRLPSNCLSSLADALQRLPVSRRQLAMRRIEMHIACPLRHFHHLREVLRRRPDRNGFNPVPGLAAPRRIGLAPVALATLLVLDPHTVHFPPRPLF